MKHQKLISGIISEFLWWEGGEAGILYMQGIFDWLTDAVANEVCIMKCAVLQAFDLEFDITLSGVSLSKSVNRKRKLN